MRMRVLLVDDHTLMRQALSGLLQGKPDIEIAGEAVDGHQAVALTRKLQPEVVLHVRDGLPVNKVSTRHNKSR
jgi:chemotaxis response regulator CheB